MDKRHRISSNLHNLSDAALIVEAQRGNKAARALLVDRTMYNVAVLFRRKWLPPEAIYLAWSSVYSEQSHDPDRGWVSPEVIYPYWSEFLRRAPDFDVESPGDLERIWKVMDWVQGDEPPFRTVHDVEDALPQLSPSAEQRASRSPDSVDSALANFLGVAPTEVTTSTYIAFLLMRVLLQRSREESAPTAEPEGIGDPQPSVDEQSWREFLGPLLNREEAKLRIGIASDLELDALVSTKQLLALPSRQGELVFPEFQFSRQGAVYRGIETILRIFGDVVATPYTIASWLRGPKEYLEGESPIRWIERERDLEPVIKGAEHAAALLAQ
jgi:hypothetical protein